jgi:hypothetical protein
MSSRLLDSGKWPGLVVLGWRDDGGPSIQTGSILRVLDEEEAGRRHMSLFVQ